MGKGPSSDLPKPTVAAVPTSNKPISWSRAALLPALLAWRFESLVTDPVSTLRTALPILAALQFAYVVLCIPPGGKKSKKKSSAIINALLALVLSAIATPAVHIVLVLFGAPFLTYDAHTFLCAAHFSLLALFPVLHARGLDAQALAAVAGLCAPLDETTGGLVGAALGAWLGAVPIPLDWDREWQRWPVTVVCGMYAGSCLGSWVSGAVFYGKRLGIDEAKEE